MFKGKYLLWPKALTLIWIFCSVFQQFLKRGFYSQESKSERKVTTFYFSAFFAAAADKCKLKALPWRQRLLFLQKILFSKKMGICCFVYIHTCVQRHSWDPKIVSTFDKWSLFIGTFMLYNGISKWWPLYAGGRSSKVVISSGLAGHLFSRHFETKLNVHVITDKIVVLLYLVKIISGFLNDLVNNFRWSITFGILNRHLRSLSYIFLK